MFCDLVSSTALAERADPEDMRDLYRDYRTACADVVARYGGFVADCFGDGLLLYFGYPAAHEDDAARAIRAGLEIVAAVRGLADRWPANAGYGLKVRVGIHTGLVVAGDIEAGGARQEMAIVGLTPNIAARLQQRAEPDTVLITASTKRLAEGLFDLEALGPQRLAGVSIPIEVFRVREQRDLPSRFEARKAVGLTPLVGREEELAWLLRCWRRARDGAEQVVLLSGEPGIGKSRLVQTLLERIAGEPATVLRYQCSPLHANSALYPVVEQLRRAAGIDGRDPPRLRLDRLTGLLGRVAEGNREALPYLAALLGIPADADRHAAQDASPQRRKERTFAALLDLLTAHAADRPLLMVFEDAHWSDPTSRDFLGRVVERAGQLPLLLVVTFRPEFAPPWPEGGHVTALALGRLGAAQARVVALGAVAGGAPLPRAVADAVVAKADGVPLFLEELARAAADAAAFLAPGASLSAEAALRVGVPDTLRDALMARLDRAGPVKEVAQIGAVIGRQFSADLLAEVAALTQDDVRRALRRLVAAGLLREHGSPPDTTYSFRHALLQEAAYENLLRSRRAACHGMVAETLERRFPGLVEEHPEVLAQHFSLAGGERAERAVAYWLRAGRRAAAASASREAVAHLEQGLRGLAQVRDAARRDELEYQLRIALGAALIALRGWASPEARQDYARAQAVAAAAGDSRRRFTASWGLYNVHLLRGEVAECRRSSAELRRVAEAEHDDDLLLGAHRAEGACRLYAGQFASARQAFERARALFDRSRHGQHAYIYGTDPEIVVLSLGAWTDWFLGLVRQAGEKSARALRLAAELRHPFSAAYAYSLAAQLHATRRDADAALEQAEAAIALSERHGFEYWIATGRIVRGWALAMRGEAARGLPELREGLRAYEATGARQLRPLVQTLLAEACARAGHPGDGLAALERLRTRGVVCFQAETLRVQGELRQAVRADADGGPEACLVAAVATARRQRARALEFRAAVSLARCLLARRRPGDARGLVVGVVRAMPEGVDAPDLAEASDLLRALGLNAPAPGEPVAPGVGPREHTAEE